LTARFPFGIDRESISFAARQEKPKVHLVHQTSPTTSVLNPSTIVGRSPTPKAQQKEQKETMNLTRFER